MPRLAALAAVLAFALREESRNDLPGPTVPRGWGVNIHFTDPQPGEMERFADARFGLARMDLFWHQVEREKGKYDFAAYDRLVRELEKANVRPLFILDYGNDLYETGAPRSPEAQDAFARFAAAAASHFRGRRVLFEIWNEPNLGQFWKPEPNADQYARLALKTARAVKAADPEAILFAPGSSGFPWEFFETVFASGLLELIDGVSVHPYRGLAPETAAADFARLRAVIARHAPPGRRYLPIVSSEWGYSTVEGGVSEARQAAYLTRMWLANLASGVNLSIFYDWRDDGDDPKENEHRFGTVRRDFRPKPAYEAARALAIDLFGYTFRHRLRGRTDDDWRLLFQRGEGDELAVVSWSADPKAADAEQMPKVRKLRASEPEGRALHRLTSVRLLPVGPLVEGGDETAQIRADVRNGEEKPVRVDVILTEAGVARSVRLGPKTVEPKQPGMLSALIPVPPLRVPERSFLARLLWDGVELPQVAPLRLMRLDPLEIAVAPAQGSVHVRVDNPSRLPFAGTVHLADGRSSLAERPLTLAEKAVQAEVDLPLSNPGATPFEVVVRGEDGSPVARLPARRYVPLAGFAGTAAASSGFERVRFVENARQDPEPLAVAPAPGPDAPAATALQIDYTFEKGWQYLQASPVRPLAIPGQAVALTLWVHADGSGDFLRSRFKDATGQTFQIDLGVLDWRGWRIVTIPLSGAKVGVYWGGANDGVLHRPLAWDGLVLIDSAHREKEHRGTVFLAAPHYQMPP